MKIFLILCLCQIVFSYDDVDESIDIDEIANDPARFQTYIDCFLDKTDCTDQMQHYKSHLQEVLNDSCRECSPLQKTKVMQLHRIFIFKYPHQLADILAKYDPEGKVFAKFAEDMTKTE